MISQKVEKFCSKGSGTTQPGNDRLNGTAARARKAALHPYLRRETMAATQTILPC